MAFTEIDEKLLVRAYQAGDERAFDTIVRTQYNALYAHALRRLSSHEAAEDAVQDTLLRAYRALANLDGDLALKAWLHRILTNVCHDEGNRRRRQQGLVDKIGALPEEVETDPADEAVLFDTVRVMADALKDLPESYREALVLRYVDGLSFREVAEATGVTEENARARVHRGKSALHKIMSRMAIMVAFIVPGLRRTQQATPTGTEQTAIVGGPEHAFTLTTQLTSHVVNASPAISRFAEISTAMPGGKSGLAAAAMTAVVAVAAPVAYTVNEVRKPDRVPAAVAAPAPTPSATTTTGASPSVGGPIADGGSDGSGGAVTSATVAPPTSTSTSSSTLPPSLARPFEGGPAVSTTVPKKPDAAASTTTTSTTSTTQPPRTEGRVLEGRIGSTALTVAGEPPQFDIEADVVVTVGADSKPGTLSGRLYLYDDGAAVSDALRLVVDGRTLNLRWRGTNVRTDEGGVVRYDVTGDYSLRDASAIGLAESGQIIALLRLPGEGEGSVTFDLRGRERS